MLAYHYLIIKYLSYLLLFFLGLHTCEILFLKKYLFSSNPFGIWHHQTLQNDIDAICKENLKNNRLIMYVKYYLSKALLLLQVDSLFYTLMNLRLIVIFFAFFYLNPWSFFFVLMTSIILNLRFRGVFNGGSDYLSFMLQWVCLIGLSFPEAKITKIALLYLAVQVLYSYFIAGYIKITKPNWRKGSALPALLHNSLSTWGQKFSKFLEQNILISQIVTYVFLAFEIGFPIIVWKSDLAAFFFGFGFVFHLFNFIFLGLNRFSHIWSISYLAVWYLITVVHN